MSADRWPPEAELLIAKRVLHLAYVECNEPLSGLEHDWAAASEEDRNDILAMARDLLEALADAGLLVEPDSKTQVQWGVLSKVHRQYPEGVWRSHDETDADDSLDYRRTRAIAGLRDPDATKVSRTIHTGPWTPDASLPSAAAPAGADSPSLSERDANAAPGVGETGGVESSTSAPP